MTKRYCTGLPTKDPALNSCCHQHDRDYGHSGAVSRSEADRRLRDCFRRAKRPILAWIVWAAVRAFGRFHWKPKTNHN